MRTEDFQRRARAAPLLMLGRRAGVFSLGLITTTCAAHLISPKAYGLAAMSALMLSLADLFKDFGLTSALMRKGVVAAEEVNFLFWLNSAGTLILAAALAAAVPLVAAFFREPAVVAVMLVSLVGFVASGVALQPRALMMRELRFAELAIIDLTVLLLQLFVTLGAALVFHNVWAIVAGNLAASLAAAVAFFSRAGWRPGKPALVADAGSLLRFGANTTLFSLSVFISNNIAQVLIGRFFGPTLLGQYNRGQNFYLLGIRNAAEPLLQAYMPILAHLRKSSEDYRATYAGLVRKITIVLAPCAVLLTFSATPLVEVLLGAKWRGAGEVLSALAPAIGVVGLAYPANDLFITQDRTSELGLLGLFEMIGRAALIALALRYGMVACAAAFSAGTIVAAGVRVLIAGARGPVSAGDQFRAAAPAAPAALCCGLGCLAAVAVEAAYPGGAALRLAGTIAIGGACALAGAWALHPSREALKELGAAFRPARARTATSA